MAAGGVKPKVTVLFYNGGGNMVKHPKANSPLQSTEKNGFSETFPFSKITFWKKKTLTSLVNYSTHLSSTRITFQNKKKYSTQYNYSTHLSSTGITFRNKKKYSTQYDYLILQLEYFIATRVCTHTSWLPEKPAAARSARGRDKVQTYYSHQGNNGTRIST